LEKGNTTVKRVRIFTGTTNKGGEIMKAYVGDDLIEQELYPACSEKVAWQDWHAYAFEIVEGVPEDFETAEGFNMVLRHPKDGRLLYVASIDFDFKH
jgi:hypothetical protein